MKAIWNDVVIAESNDTVIVEGNHYFPINSIKSEYFKKTDLTTFCGWKGMANYYSVTVNGKINKTVHGIMKHQMMLPKRSKGWWHFGMVFK